MAESRIFRNALALFSAPSSGNIEDRRTGVTEAQWNALNARLWRMMNLPGDDDDYTPLPGARTYNQLAWDAAHHFGDYRWRPHDVHYGPDRGATSYVVRDIHSGTAPRDPRKQRLDRSQ